MGARARGRFGPIAISVPAKAIPGRHWISAKGHRSGQIVQEPFTVRTNWPQFRYSNQHTGLNPYENVLNPRDVARLALDWRFRIGGKGSYSSPAVVHGVVYVGSEDGSVYALNAATGARLWSFPRGTVRSSPAVVHGVVFIGSDDGNVYALNAATGARLWRFWTGVAIESAPAVVHGVVRNFVPPRDGVCAIEG